MGFLLKAGFWVCVVLLFLPREHGQIKQPRITAKISAASAIDLANAGINLCQHQPAVCEAAMKTGAASKDILASVTSLFVHLPTDKKDTGKPRS